MNYSTSFRESTAQQLPQLWRGTARKLVVHFACKPALGVSAVVLTLLLVGVKGGQQLMPQQLMTLSGNCV